MEALFYLRATYRMTGVIRDGETVLLLNGQTMKATGFEVLVMPRAARRGQAPRLSIDRYITVTGPVLKGDGEPGALRGKMHYWLSEEGNPDWVLGIARRIEETECPFPKAPESLVL